MKKIAAREATAEVVLRKNYVTDAGEYPVKLRITFDRKARFYPVNVNGKPVLLTESDWAELQKEKCPKRLREYREAKEAVNLAGRESIRKITANGKPFTWERFEQEFLQADNRKGFLSLFKEHLKTIKAENRIGTYKSYQNAYNSFKRFRNEKDFSPADLTPELLRAYDAHLIKSGCGKTTIGIYTRALKVIFNIAIEHNPTLLEVYPFARKQTDRNRYKIKKGSGHKGEAMTVEQLQKFISLKPANDLEHEAKSLWLFSFYCQGMNMKDICLLKYQDIIGDSIRYVRAKTKDTEAEETLMEIPLSDSIRKIIRTFGNPDKKPGSYVFPAVPDGLASTVKRRTKELKTTEERIYEIIKQKNKIVNERLKAICKSSNDPDLKDLNLTGYWARHTYASLLKHSGESVDLIRELLGHSDIRTTESYLKRFDINKKKAANERIESLLKVS